LPSLLIYINNLFIILFYLTSYVLYYINKNKYFSCVAGGYPTPTYEWFKEDYDNQDQLVSLKIDPLSNKRFTLSGGTLIIYAPKRVKISFIFKSLIKVYK